MSTLDSEDLIFYPRTRYQKNDATIHRIPPPTKWPKLGNLRIELVQEKRLMFQEFVTELLQTIERRLSSPEATNRQLPFPSATSTGCSIFGLFRYVSILSKDMFPYFPSRLACKFHFQLKVCKGDGQSMEPHTHTSNRPGKGVFGVWVSVEALLVPITSACGPQLAGNCGNRKRWLGYCGHAWLDLVYILACVQLVALHALLSLKHFHLEIPVVMWPATDWRCSPSAFCMLPNYSPLSTKWPKGVAVRMACGPTPRPSMTYLLGIMDGQQTSFRNHQL